METKDKQPLTLWEVTAIVDKIKFNGFKFHVFQDGQGYKATICIQGKFMSLLHDNNGVEPQWKYTRTWRLESDYTETQVVKTVFNLVNAAMEFEVRHEFTYEGYDIFSPDFNVRDIINDKQRLAHNEIENNETPIVAPNEKPPADVA